MPISALAFNTNFIQINNNMKNISLLLFCLFIGLTTLSCVKRDFDMPPVSGNDPDLIANTTIKALKAKHSFGAFEQITEDLVIRASVTADDRSGNFFKKIIIQDETAGIEVSLNATDQYTKFPIGRRIFIKLKGLYLGDLNGTIQIGTAPIADSNGNLNIGRIEDTVIDNYLFPGIFEQFVAPTNKKIGELTQNDISLLVSFDDTQFVQGDTSRTYSDKIGLTTQNRIVEDCNGSMITVRTSGYSSFAGDPIPNGKGKITGIYSVFGTTLQLGIRELTDVAYSVGRCGGGGTGGTTLPNTTIAQLKALWSTGFQVIAGDVIVGGTVTANDEKGNIFKQIYIKDATGGLGIKINLTNIFQTIPVGSYIVIKCKGLTLGVDNVIKLGGGTFTPSGSTTQLLGGMDATQVGANVEVQTTGNPVISELVTLEGLNDGDLSKLIKLENVQFVNGDVNQTYADKPGLKSLNRIVEDCNGNTIVVRTSGYADFAADLTPALKGTLVGVYEVFGTTKQLYIRDPNDAVMVDSRCNGGNNPTTLLDMTFEGLSLVDNVNLALPGWSNVGEVGNDKWKSQVFSGDTYAEMRSFQSTDLMNVTWLVTPGLDGSTGLTFSFESAIAFWKHNGLTVYYSTNFNGTNTATANWVELPATIAGTVQANYDVVNSGDLNIPSFGGNVFIGFKYIGDKSNNTTTYQLDNIKVLKK